MADEVLYDTRGSVALITLNRPRYRNAQNSAMTYALDAAFARATSDDRVAVIVLAGAGDHFSAGHGIGTPERDVDRSFTRQAVLWRRAGDPSDTAVAYRVADAWIGARAYQLHTQATAVRLAGGGTPGAEASMGKVFWSELDLALHETALDLLGPLAEVRAERWLDGYLFALAGPIYAGTNEIQRTVIAERLLGLPRASR
jgi:alkylation response protein AidB-like acyl-CoA dehydrogenase